MRIDIFNPQGNYIGYEERDDGDTGILVTKETRTYAERKLISIERYAGGASGVTAAISYKMEWEYGTGETGGAGSTEPPSLTKRPSPITTLGFKSTRRRIKTELRCLLVPDRRSRSARTDVAELPTSAITTNRPNNFVNTNLQ